MLKEHYFSTVLLFKLIYGKKIIWVITFLFSDIKRKIFRNVVV